MYPRITYELVVDPLGSAEQSFGITGLRVQIRAHQQNPSRQYWDNASRIFFFFKYIRGSACRNSRLKKSNEMQQYAHIYLLLNYSTCFGRPSRPSSGVHKTVAAASGTYHTIWVASFFKRDHVVSFEEACYPDSTICTRGCSYSFMYS